MRSMPPSSSHLADSPVPAPPPMIGSRRRIMPRKRFRMASRAMRAMALPRIREGGHRPARDLAKGRDQRVDELGIVHVARQPPYLPARRDAHAGEDGVEGCLV